MMKIHKAKKTLKKFTSISGQTKGFLFCFEKHKATNKHIN